MMFSRMMVATATTAAGPCGGGTCPVFQARMRIFTANNSTEPTEGTLEDITTQAVKPVFNLGRAVKVGDQVLVGFTVDRRWVRISEPPVCKAKEIKFQYTYGTGFDGVLDFYNGSDPSADGGSVEVDYPLGEPCEDAEVLAFCDENTGRYQAYATESAMLGPATNMNIVQSLAFDGCGINYIKQMAKVFPCRSAPSLIEIEPALSPTSVLTGVALLPAIEACANTCTYTWNAGLGSWVITSGGDSACGAGCICGPAPVGPPGTGEPTEVVVSCIREDGLTPRSALLSFTTSSILVCSATSGSDSSIPLTECPPAV